MPTKVSQTPLLDADRERRGRCYFACDLVFEDVVIADEFSQKVPKEIEHFVHNNVAELTELGIILSITHETAPLQLSLEIQHSDIFSSDPDSVKDTFEETLRSLQTNFLCSFNSEPYIDARMSDFWGEDFEFPNVSIDSRASARGRRMILQHSRATLRSVERQLERLEESDLHISQEDRLPAKIKEQSLSQNQTLRNSLEAQLQNLKKSNQLDVLAALGEIRVELAALPEPVIEESLKPAFSPWEKIGSRIEVLAPNRCATKAEIAFHPVMISALRRIVEVEDQSSMLSALSEVLLSPEDFGQLIDAVKKILRRINRKKQLNENQILIAINTLFELTNYVKNNPQQSPSEELLKSPPSTGAVAQISADGKWLDYPESFFFLLDVLNHNDILPEGYKKRDWLNTVLSSNPAVYEDHLFIGKRFQGYHLLAFNYLSGMTSVKPKGSQNPSRCDNFPPAWEEELGPVLSTKKRYIGAFIDGLFHRNNGGEFEAIKVSVPEHIDPEGKVDLVSLEIKNHGLQFKSDPYSKEDTPYVYVKVKFSNNEVSDIFLHTDKFAPVILDKQLVVRCNKVAEAQSEKPVHFFQLQDGTAFFQLEVERQKFRLCLDGKFVHGMKRESLSGESSHRDLSLRCWLMKSGVNTRRVFADGDMMMVQAKSGEPLHKEEIKLGVIKRRVGNTIKQGGNKGSVFIKQATGSRTKRVFVKMAPSDLTWEAVDDSGKIIPGQTLDGVKFSEIF